MNTLQQVITIATVVIGTQLTRWLPFLVFRSNLHTPACIHYLGKVLPPAIFGMLVIYSYKDIDLSSLAHAIPEIFSGICVAVIQLLFKNMCISIVAGTAIYILWVN